uniref:RING-type domain-containing protein n=2 Tax=Kalanchoe fedtschenkoi TaxID=63787 RepID=A0A7N0ZR96_KALFE
MGAACCVVAKSKSVSDEPNLVTSRINSRYSSSWNVRWDNRGCVAGEETAVRWFADMSSRDSQLENISETAVRAISEVGSPENFQPPAWSVSPLPEGGVGVPDFRFPYSDASIFRSISMEGKLATDYNGDPDRSPVIHSLSSVSASPLSTGGHLFHASPTPARLTRRIPGNQLYMQASDGRTLGFKSPGTYWGKPSPLRPGWANDSARGSHGGSSDGWSIPEYTASAHRERWSFDSDSLGFNNRDTITRSSSRHSSSPSFHIKTCGVCSKLLSDKSSFGSQKLIPTNELAVVAVLVCGHVYHPECLERMTLEVSKYDPACPVCTFGEQQALKLSEKAIKAEMESRFKSSKRSRSRIIDSEFNSNLIGASHGVGKGVKIDSGSGTKSSFLKRHFSLGSKGNKAWSESQSSKKKTLFWTRSGK